MSGPIHAAPHGQNLVIENRSGRVIIGRFDSSNGFEILVHDCDIYDPPADADVEHYIREAATYGVEEGRPYWRDGAWVAESGK